MTLSPQFGEHDYREVFNARIEGNLSREEWARWLENPLFRVWLGFILSGQPR